MADMTSQYNTDLTPIEQRDFSDWVMKQRQATQRDPLADRYDYDIQGWWKAHRGEDLGSGHLTDEFKKPNHPTFSKESKYSGVDGHEGGEWGGSEGAWSFTPGKTNMQMFSPQELQDYFSRVEPDTKLLMPEAVQ